MIYRSRHLELAWFKGFALTVRGSHERKGATICVGLFVIRAWLRIYWPWRNLMKDARKWGVEYHHQTLWWTWGAPENSWRRDEPWWMRWSWTPVDFFFGRRECKTTEGEKRSVVVPMPEGSYPATVKQEARVYSRRRWPRKRTVVSWWLEIPGGIPYQGKGENSWDCGDDGLWGIGGDTPEKAVGNAVASVLRSRRRYGETGETRGRIVLARPKEVQA